MNFTLANVALGEVSDSAGGEAKWGEQIRRGCAAAVVVEEKVAGETLGAGGILRGCAGGAAGCAVFWVRKMGLL